MLKQVRFGCFSRPRRGRLKPRLKGAVVFLGFDLLSPSKTSFSDIIKKRICQMMAYRITDKSYKVIDRPLFMLEQTNRKNTA